MLASKNLYTDGAEVLWEFARQADDDDPDTAFARGLIVPRSRQYVFKGVVEHYLRQASFSEDKYTSLIRLPQYQHTNVVLDPRRGFGQPIFGDSAVRVSDATAPLRAGESFDAVAEDYGVSVSHSDLVPRHWSSMKSYCSQGPGAGASLPFRIASSNPNEPHISLSVAD